VEPAAASAALPDAPNENPAVFSGHPRFPLHQAGCLSRSRFGGLFTGPERTPISFECRPARIVGRGGVPLGISRWPSPAVALTTRAIARHINAMDPLGNNEAFATPCLAAEQGRVKGFRNRERHLFSKLPPIEELARRGDRHHALTGRSNRSASGIRAWGDLLPIARCAGPGGAYAVCSCARKIATAALESVGFQTNLKIMWRSRAGSFRLIPAWTNATFVRFGRDCTANTFLGPPNCWSPACSSRRRTCWPQVRINRTEG